jgi:hypothetical protein
MFEKVVELEELRVNNNVMSSVLGFFVKDTFYGTSLPFDELYAAPLQTIQTRHSVY